MILFALRIIAGFSGWHLVKHALESMQLESPEGKEFDLSKCSPEKLQWLYDISDEETRVMIKSFM